MNYATDAVVVGAGVIGLAVARQLALSGLETIVVERRGGVGEETSSRNSEIIHAGIYYPPDSLKARACVRGRDLLYRYAEAHGIPHRRTGKLVVAAEAGGLARLDAIQAIAEQCGVDNLRRLGQAELEVIEPEVRGVGGLLSPSTGIIDSHQLLLSLQGELEAHGGSVALGSPVLGGRLQQRGQHRLRVGGDTEIEISCGLLVNAAGLKADSVSACLQGCPPRGVLSQFYAKGHYFSYSGPAPFQRLVYPLPEPGGLGIHATLDLAGQTRFGPDVCWVDAPDYTFQEGIRERFLDAIADYFPGVEAERLQPGYTGLRPKLVGPGEPAADFLVLGPAEHGVPGFCSLYGIESPGLTACLALAEDVCRRLLPTQVAAGA